MGALLTICHIRLKRYYLGYDVSYARTFKNARWARVHATVYHWNGLSVPNHSDALLKTLEVGNSHGWKLGTTLQVTPHVR